MQFARFLFASLRGWLGVVGLSGWCGAEGVGGGGGLGGVKRIKVLIRVTSDRFV